ncbi:MAG: sugar transferase [Paludisphaera borealis]|uniref:sugar transferase n=1 Tax=Paludisphaera borealis TaxID=1387353 RepID=UPI0028435616|nr:sugar transferase [Paludisphaera borealis]MDR3622829.1 sugar transferase [Paludisphaera borealis]
MNTITTLGSGSNTSQIISPGPLETSIYGTFGKRLLDVVLASSALFVLSPLFLVVAWLIRLNDGGPVFFRQKRHGKDGASFFMYKFRSMKTTAEAQKAALLADNQHGRDGVTFKMKADPRITRVGAWLRRTSLDELPQLWNVVLGDMSLVGPRPPVAAEYAKYTDYQKTRLAVTPGLTCLWQIKGRAEIPFEGQVELDREYVATRSLLLDLKILVLTIPAVVSGRGAY